MDTQSPVAASELNAGYFDLTASIADIPCITGGFATMPMLIAKPVYSPPDEEELHTSFEQAISDRVLIVHKQLSLRSDALTYTQRQDPHTGSPARLHAPLQRDSAKFPLVLAGKAWLQNIIFGSLALLLLLMGFDLMGLLVLSIR